jgi:hypothetical protein
VGSPTETRVKRDAQNLLNVVAFNDAVTKAVQDGVEVDKLAYDFATVPDFGDAPQLFTCAKCGALFAVDPEQEFYETFIRWRKAEALMSRVWCDSWRGVGVSSQLRL